MYKCASCEYRQQQKDRLRGKNVIDVKYKSSQIKSAIEKQIKNGKYKSENIYGDGLSTFKFQNYSLN